MVFSSRTIVARNANEERETAMTSRIEPYRVSAYNTSKHSENKMHDDTVAKRYGFSGGLGAGVDVMAYMMHLPVAKWGRPFFERGLIEARFIKPVYDGELADVTGEESTACFRSRSETRGEKFARDRQCIAAAAAPSFPLSDYVEVAAVGERKPVNAASYALGKWLGAVAAVLCGDAAQQYLSDIRETEAIYLARRSRASRPVAAG